MLVICGLFALTIVATPHGSNVGYPFYLEEQVSGEQYSHSQKRSCSWCWTLFNLAVFGHGEFGLCLWDDWDHHLVSACNGFVFCYDCQEEVLAVSDPIQQLWQVVPCFWFGIVPSYTKCWCSHVFHPLITVYWTIMAALYDFFSEIWTKCWNFNQSWHLGMSVPD